MTKFIIPLFLVTFICSCGESVEKTGPANQNGSPSQEEKVLRTDTSQAGQESVPDEVISTDCDANLRAYISDPGDTPTNVRSSPGGEILMSLEHNQDYEITIVGAQNGWFRVNEIYGFESEHLNIPGNYGWIHGSVIELSTRNYGGEVISVYEKDDKNSAVVETLDSETLVRPQDICGEWVKIKFTSKNGETSGWIEKDWLCGSAVTNCS